jgi:hypothetical protein
LNDGTLKAVVVERSNPKLSKQRSKIQKAVAKKLKRDVKQESLKHSDISDDSSNIDGMFFILPLDTDGFVSDVIHPFGEEGDTMTQNDNSLDDKLQHWGIKGMEWKHKKKKNDDDLKNKLSSLISRMKKKAKPIAKKVERTAKKAVHDSKPVLKKVEHEAKKQASSARKKAVKQIARVKKEAKEKWNGKPVKSKKPLSYSTDFVGDAKKRSAKANEALSKKRTAEGRKEIQGRAKSLKKAWENEHWKNLTKEVRKEQKDKAVGDYYNKMKKSQDAKAANKNKAINDYYKNASKSEAARKSADAKKQKSVDKYWKNKTKSDKPHSAKNVKDFGNKFGAKESLKQIGVESKRTAKRVTDSVDKGIKKEVKKALKSVDKTKAELVKNSKPKWEVIDLNKADHIGKLKRDKKAEAMFRSKKFQDAYKKHTRKKQHQ